MTGMSAIDTFVRQKNRSQYAGIFTQLANILLQPFNIIQWDKLIKRRDLYLVLHGLTVIY